jgi:hypothetical protein
MRSLIAIGVLFALSTSSEALSVRSDPFKDLMLPRVVFTNASLSEVATTLEQEYSTHRRDGYPKAVRFVIQQPTRWMCIKRQRRAAMPRATVAISY